MNSNNNNISDLGFIFAAVPSSACVGCEGELSAALETMSLLSLYDLDILLKSTPLDSVDRLWRQITIVFIDDRFDTAQELNGVEEGCAWALRNVLALFAFKSWGYKQFDENGSEGRVVSIYTFGNNRADVMLSIFIPRDSFGHIPGIGCVLAVICIVCSN
jgi:hypothetical protein